MKKWNVIVEYVAMKEVEIETSADCDVSEALRAAVAYADGRWPQDGAWEVIDWEEVNDQN